MESPQTTKLVVQGLVIKATPLTREAFAPFGDVVVNPQPSLHPSAPLAPSLPFRAAAANQGSAIKYQHVSRQVNLYDQAPSGRPGSAILSMFVCAARARLPEQALPVPSRARAPAPAPAPAPAQHRGPPLPCTFPVSVLERHPFTTQTFIPLTASPTAHYLVIVAPTVPCSRSADGWPVPSHLPVDANYPRPLPGGGMPDLRHLRAFVGTSTQAVTYGAGTWHAPMVALGDGGTAMDFVVVQFANGVRLEDCQEVFFESSKSPSAAGGGGILVKLNALKKEVQDVGRAKL